MAPPNYTGPSIGPSPKFSGEQKQQKLDESIQLFMKEKNPKYENTFIDQKEYRINEKYREAVDEAKIQKHGFDTSYGKWEKKDGDWNVDSPQNALSAFGGGLMRPFEKAFLGDDEKSTISSYQMPDSAMTKTQQVSRFGGEMLGYALEYAPFSFAGKKLTQKVAQAGIKKAVKEGLKQPLKQRLRSHVGKKVLTNMVTDATAFGTISALESRGDPVDTGMAIGMGLAFPPALQYVGKPVYNQVKTAVRPYTEKFGQFLHNKIKDGTKEMTEEQVKQAIQDPNKVTQAVGNSLKETGEDVLEKQVKPGNVFVGAADDFAKVDNVPKIEMINPKQEIPKEELLKLGETITDPLPKYAENINLQNINTTDDVKNLINNVSKTYEKTMQTQKRGVVSHEQTKQLADDLGMTVEDLMKRRKGQAFNPHEALASRELLVKSAEDTHKLAQLAQAGDDKAVANFITQLYRHVAIQEQVTGVAAEAGRTLNAFRIGANRSKSPEAIYKEIIKAVGGRENFTDEIARKVASLDMNDIAAVNTFLREVTEASTFEKIQEAWIMSLLSGPKTHIVNATSNALTMMSKPLERGAAAGIDLVRASLTKSPRQRFFLESAADTFGMLKGFPDGLRAGLEAFRTELPSQGLSKLELGQKHAIKGNLGKVVRLPGRLLLMMDELFKSMNFTSEMYAQAYRQAVKDGAKNPKELTRMIAEIVKNPSDELKVIAEEDAVYRTFQKELGPFGKWISRGRNIRDQKDNLNPGSKAMRLIVPFLRTPINIAKYGLERTPLNYIKIISDVRKGKITGGQISDEAAKATLGTLMAIPVAIMAQQGVISGGGPRDPQIRNALRATGWQPYSIKIGNNWYSYGRLEPLGMIFGMTADYVELNDVVDSAEAVSKIQFAIAQNLMNKTFLKGVSDTINAISYPERFGENWVASYVSSVVPTGVSQIAGSLDDAPRKSKGILNRVKYKVPGIRNDLPLMYDIWGNPISYTNTGKERLLSPINRTEVVDDPITNEVVALKVRPGNLREYITKKGQKIELTEDEFAKLNQLAGKKARKWIERIMTDPMFKYNKLDDDAKRDKLENAFRKSKQWARDQLKIGILKRALKQGKWNPPEDQREIIERVLNKIDTIQNDNEEK